MGHGSVLGVCQWGCVRSMSMGHGSVLGVCQWGMGLC